MSAETQNTAILQRAYARWLETKGSDFDCWLSVMADDVKLTSLSNGSPAVPFTSARKGHAEIIEYLQGLTDAWAMDSYDIDEYVAQGDRVVAIGSTSWTNKQTGKIMRTPKIDIWRLRDGKIIEYSEFYDTENVHAAAAPWVPA